MAPTGISDIKKTYDVFESVRGIEPPCINFKKKKVPGVESATARSTRCQFCNLGERNCSQANQRFTDNPRRLWSSIQKGGIFGLEAPVDEPPTSDTTSCHPDLTGSRMRGIQKINNTNTSWANTGGPIPPQGNPIGVAPEVPILVTRKDGRLGKLKHNLLVQDEIDTDAEGSHEIYGKYSTRPSTLSSTSANIKPPMTSTSRDPMSPEPESILEHH
ncbi:hypothetical protein O181_030723 [Austropuccinia psidii MF-1]|uniref:Uncharacterized protein n=1 Tax=Austropuccinia psidii MF-1 TaxID=1389203 RepID=A0A9Q3CY84_9BASI|nr:hypothetical protein [Austropuccinia psidii MF-1]